MPKFLVKTAVYRDDGDGSKLVAKGEMVKEANSRDELWSAWVLDMKTIFKDGLDYEYHFSFETSEVEK